jgi:hypothetical protein
MPLRTLQMQTPQFLPGMDHTVSIHEKKVKTSSTHDRNLAHVVVSWNYLEEKNSRTSKTTTGNQLVFHHLPTAAIPYPISLLNRPQAIRDDPNQTEPLIQSHEVNEQLLLLFPQCIAPLHHLGDAVIISKHPIIGCLMGKFTHYAA